ncbi:pseudaminic acid synthase [Candidatus Gottesmanbacteria bacterium]|nr:pseudaminic acid synthase [Candidatus Gottesmanbacteria bacterium]
MNPFSLQIKIGNKKIGDHSPVFIVAELSGNHNHNFDIAVKTLKAIKDSGADAVKLQTYTADTLTINENNKYFRIKSGSLWYGKTLYDLYKEAYTPWEWHPKLQKIAQDLGLILFSTPFDETATDFLDKMDVPVFKISSFEAVDPYFVNYVAAKKKPVFISSGLTDLDDLYKIKKIFMRNGNNKLVFLKCTSLYPTPFKNTNLSAITTMREKLKTLVGLSDHTLGINVPVAAVTLGARVIEKHFILDKKLGGPDSPFSLDFKEFKSMVKSIRQVEQALGNPSVVGKEKYNKSRPFSRSLFAVEDIKKGGRLTKKNIRSIRPGFGLAPKYYDKILGKKAQKFIKRGTPLSWDLIS